jgi:hypothetical protein
MLDDAMAAELPFLPGFSCGLRRKYFQVDTPEDPMHATQIHELNFWFSNGNTYSTIHYDMNHQIMCQIDGKKEWRFWDLRTEKSNIPMWSEFYEKEYRSDDAPIDPMNVDLDSFPNFLNAKWTNTTLNPGECLLIPSYHSLHYVRGYPGERNMGFSVHISPIMITADHFYECDKEVENITYSDLGKFNVTLPFPGDPRESGYNRIRMGQSDWKDLSMYAVKELVRSSNRDLSEIISDLTGGRSNRSKRISSLLRDVLFDNHTELNIDGLLRIFNHGPLWREVQYLMP